MASITHLFHFTAAENLDNIRKQEALFSASELLKKNGGDYLSEWLRRPRPDILPLPDGTILRDQKGLREGQVELRPGFSFEDWVEKENHHVFFWPEFPEKFKEAYPKDICICCSFTELQENNQGKETRFCKYISGFPRSSPHRKPNRKSPRGPDMFELLTDKIWQKHIKEIVFESKIVLPKNTKFLCPFCEKWRTLLSNDGH